MSGVQEMYQRIEDEQRLTEVVTELREDVARLRERDGKWTAAFWKLFGLVPWNKRTQRKLGFSLWEQGETYAHNAKRVEEWAGAPEPLEEHITRGGD